MAGHLGPPLSWALHVTSGQVRSPSSYMTPLATPLSINHASDWSAPFILDQGGLTVLPLLSSSLPQPLISSFNKYLPAPPMQQTQSCPQGACTLVAMPPHSLEIVSHLPPHPFLPVQIVRLLIPMFKYKFFPQTFPNLSPPRCAPLCDTHSHELYPIGTSHTAESLVFLTVKFSFSKAIFSGSNI